MPASHKSVRSELLRLEDYDNYEKYLCLWAFPIPLDYRWISFLIGLTTLPVRATVYQGLTNTALGSASVAISCCISNLGSGGQDGLTITNLGSSGQDGVSIALPANLTRLDVEYEPLDVSDTLPVGAYIQSQAVGTADGITNGVLGTLTVTKTGTSNYTFSADYSPIGVSTYTVRAYLHGALVVQATNQKGASLAKANTLPNGNNLGDIITPLSDEWPGQVVSVIIGTTKVQCDHLIVSPENVPFVIVPTTFQIVASQVPSITIGGENASLIYQGLANTALGSASAVIACCVSNLGSGGQDGLTISNLGSSGQDGVSIALPASLTGLVVGYEPLDVGDTLPVGAYVQSQVVGTANGTAGGVLGTLTVTKTGTTNYMFLADLLQIGASTYTVQAYLQGVLVTEVTNQSGGPFASSAVWPPQLDWQKNDEGSPTLSVHWLSATTVSFLGAANVTCDQLIISPVNATSGSLSTAFQIVASQVPAITIGGENASLIYQGLANTALGSASAVISCCVSNLGSGGQDGVTISNLGSSGQDGVSVALPASLTGLEVEYEPLDVGDTLPVGAYVQSQVVGTANGTAGGVLGTLTVAKTGTTNYILSADLLQIGASTYTVQAYLQGVLVTEVTNQSGGPFASSAVWPPQLDWQKNDEGSPTLSVHWLSATTVSFLGAANVTCDQLIISPVNATSGIMATAFQIVASQVPVITIAGENGSLIYQGLANTALGSASAVISCCVSNLGSGGQDGVTISNLGSSGQDGVSVALPASLTGLEVEYEPLDVGDTLPVGAYVQSQVVGTANGTAGVLGTLTVTKTGTTNYIFLADFLQIGAGTYTVQAYLQGVLVTEVTNQGGGPFASSAVWPPQLDWQKNDEGSPTLSVHWLSATTVSFLGAANVTCDQLIISPVNATSGSLSTAFQIVASQVPAITIGGENASLIYQGLANTALGSASAVIACCVSNLGSGGQDGLTISNLGSSGQDGVSIVVPRGVALEVEWQPLDLADTLPVGAYLQEQIVGTANDITNGVMGTVTMTKLCAVCDESNYVMSADFSPVGATHYTVQAYVNGRLVGQATNQSGPSLAYCDIWGNSGCIPRPPLIGGGWDWETNYTGGPLPLVTIPGLPSVQCDILYIIPENVSGTPTAFQITASQVPVLNIVAMATSPLLLSSSVSGQNLTLQWFGAGILQTSADLKSWSSVNGATSPYAVTIGGASQFYRVETENNAQNTAAGATQGQPPR